MSARTFHRVFGIDPGPIPGIVMLTTCDRRLVNRNVVQCSQGMLYDVLRALDPHHAVIGVERFVARGLATSAQAETRDQVASIIALFLQAVVRSASEVKPWAADTRLDAAGLLEATKRMRNAKDAAVKADLVADPLARGGHLR